MFFYIEYINNNQKNIKKRGGYEIQQAWPYKYRS